ncbi:MAG: bifunctional non-ous end joining protein LigD [Gaiellales bacterium]|nr:bifunctional non-ous end joining protein LigD [Gaiellales bacterium]
MADLEEYQAKRHAGKTPEPLKSKRKRKRGDPIFVVQRHSARRLHYDLRLERDGALMSWALPRGVPVRGGERSLAVHVEDHPLEYATFEGDIPAGQYGAGWVEVWDHGTYEVVKERPDGTLTVILHGERLQGEWALVPARLDGEERNWLIVRADKMGALGKARTYTPMLAKPAKRIPSGGDWAFEIAWDGTRALAPMEGAKARFEHAGGQKLDARCKQLLARMPRAIRSSECVLDGVIWELDEGVAYVVFDLLELDGLPLLDEPWQRRRELLEELLDEHVGEVRLSKAYDDGTALREAARAQGLGIVAKRRGSRYRAGVVSDDWRRLR